MNKLKTQRLVILAATCLLSACVDEHTGSDPSLEMYLEGIELSCDELRAWDFTKGFLVKRELDGWGVLIISRNNEPNRYDLSLVAHMHERVFESRVIQCEKL